MTLHHEMSFRVFLETHCTISTHLEIKCSNRYMNIFAMPRKLRFFTLAVQTNRKKLFEHKFFLIIMSLRRKNVPLWKGEEVLLSWFLKVHQKFDLLWHERCQILQKKSFFRRQISQQSTSQPSSGSQVWYLWWQGRYCPFWPRWLWWLPISSKWVCPAAIVTWKMDINHLGREGGAEDGSCHKCDAG